MNINKSWFWQYQIYFDEKLKAKLIRKSNTLKHNYKELFLKEIGIFSSFFTFQMLIDKISDEPKILDKIELKDIVSTPACLESYYRAIIKNNYNNNPKLYDILNYTIKYGKTLNLYDDLWKDYFTKSELNALLEHNLKKVKLTDKYKHLDIMSVKKTYEEYLLKNKSKFRNLKLDYDLIIKNGSSYGEYWDKDLYDEVDNNTLIIYKNKKNTGLDLLYTFVHELLGHANSFQIFKLNDQFIDLGAGTIIEGFATLCELIYNLDIDYQNNLYIKYANILKLSFTNDSEKMYHLYGKNSVINCFQYPNYLQSYYIGAFTLKKYIEKNSLCELYTILKKKPVVNGLLKELNI